MKKILSLLFFVFLCGCIRSGHWNAVDSSQTAVPSFSKQDLEIRADLKKKLDALPNTLGDTVSNGHLSDLSVPQDNIVLTKGYDAANGMPFIVTIYYCNYYKLTAPMSEKLKMFKQASLEDIKRMSDAKYLKAIRPNLTDEQIDTMRYADFTEVLDRTIMLSNRTTYETEFQFTTGGAERKSFLYLFALDDSTMVKIRISYPKEGEQIFDPMRAGFLKAFGLQII